MTRSNLQDILRDIEALDDEERLLLERRLAERAQREWEGEACEARQVARERGIDQAVIDQAVERRRYGR